MTLAEQIRTLLAARDPHTVDGAAQIAADYSAQCRMVNDRLSRCAGFLRRGLRSEAVHLAECHPNVIQSAEELQYPGSLELERLYNVIGLSVPEEPNSTVIEDLRTAIETEQSLAPLLSLHRTLAVGRGPIRQRLAVLYALAQRDPETTLWQNDIKLMEVERIKGIDREYKIALRDADLATLESLGEEIAGTHWQRPLPRELVQRVGKSAQSVRRGTRIATLREIIHSLQTARDNRDENQCAKLLDQWQSLTSTADVRELELPADLLADGSQEIQDAGLWLTGERRRRLEGQRHGERRSNRPPAQNRNGTSSGAMNGPMNGAKNGTANGTANGAVYGSVYGSHYPAGSSGSDRRRSLLSRGLSLLVSPLRFLIPQRYRSEPAAPEPMQGLLRNGARIDHNV